MFVGFNLLSFFSTKTSSKGVIASPNWPRSSLTYCKWELDRSSRDGYLIHFMDIKKQRSSYCYSDDQKIEVKGKFSIQTSVKFVWESETVQEKFLIQSFYKPDWFKKAKLS